MPTALPGPLKHILGLLFHIYDFHFEIVALGDPATWTILPSDHIIPTTILCSWLQCLGRGGIKAHFKVAFVAALKQHWQQGRQGHEHGYIKKKSMVFTLVMVTACVMFNTGYERHWDPVAGIVIIICEQLLRSLSIRWNNNNY